MPDDVPMKIKQRRHRGLLDLQNQISYENNQRFVGQPVEVLGEGPGKNPHLNATAKIDKPSPHPHDSSELQLLGRTPGDRIVVFNGHETTIGEIIPVKVTKVSALTLFAEQVKNMPV